jgi:outer membrane receptor protein involved in Fe transport
VRKRFVIGAVVAASTPALAQPAKVTDVEVPQLILNNADDSAGTAADEQIDLANIVQSAAKGVTTVQEAPAIVTVITADEIKDRQFQDIMQIIDTVPGWQAASIYFGNYPTPLVRGEVQAVQFLHDGVSLFDPFANIPATNETQPLEMIKRLEFITGPGGVLWGSNSLLGILNVITKDAEDVDGVEVGASVGDGSGDKNYARAYVMAGKPDLMNGKLKLFGHASVTTYQGPSFEMPLLLFQDPLPQPNSPNEYGPLTTSNSPQSVIVNLDAKVTYDKLQLRVSVPFGRMYRPLGLPGEPVQANAMNPADPEGAATKNRMDDYDRYAVLEYRTRFAEDKAGLTAKVYGIQFVRDFDPLQALAPSTAIPGGLDFSSNLTSYRVGGALDGDIELAKPLRVLYGAETFHEWKPADNVSKIDAPYNLNVLPLLCPRTYDPTTMTLTTVPSCPLTFAYSGDRTVLGAYVDPQYRPNKELIFDAGARIQAAPGALGSLSYSPTMTFSGTIVWNFITNWHLKLNYAEGFRPPVFNNTLSNGQDVQIAGNPDLTVERSRAVQAEINARIWKGDRRIRELSFRVDASYTELSNLIQVESGEYRNSGERGIASAEFLGTLYLQGGHRIQLGYTYLNVDSSDQGEILSVPNNWFNLTGVWNLVTNHLTATTNLKVMGSTEDPNRLVEYRDLMYGIDGTPATTTTLATDLVLDQLPPIAELSAGLSYSPVDKLSIRATVYDALGGHYYYPDVFFDYEPHLEYLPNPEAGFRAFVTVMYQH